MFGRRMSASTSNVLKPPRARLEASWQASMVFPSPGMALVTRSEWRGRGASMA